MDSRISWPEVQSLFSRVRGASVATVDEDGGPRITPIGSVTLTGDWRGCYFEKFPRALPRNLDRDPRFCIMAVRPDALYWLSALWRGRFGSLPAVRLFCRAGERRKATPEEAEAWFAKIRPYRFFKGYDLLWKDMGHVREFTVLGAEGVNMGRMTP